jgi:hypothetical protein
MGKSPFFGIENYRVPKQAAVTYSTKNSSFSKCKVPGFIDAANKAKAHIPSPSNYDSKVRWDSLDNRTYGKFKGSPR